ncbi:MULTISPECIES: hypothetical protein [Streptomyces]|uniref:hypothetical protein n=1 Tax=Streptomyces TaxID=1883 RepID=UPI0033D934C3
MANATGLDHPPTSYLTLRVYRVDRHGTITRDSGKVTVPPAEEVEAFSAFPPCQCPLHRDGEADSRC